MAVTRTVKKLLEEKPEGEKRKGRSGLKWRDEVELKLSNIGVKKKANRKSTDICREGRQGQTQSAIVLKRKTISVSTICLYQRHFISICSFSGNNDTWLNLEIRSNYCPFVKSLSATLLLFANYARADQNSCWYFQHSTQFTGHIQVNANDS